MNNINDVSNFIKANVNSMSIYNKPVLLSTRKNKKYMILDENNRSFVHFGDLRYKDFLKTNDYYKRSLYYKRSSKIRGDWRNNEYSPNMLSMRILWKINM